MDDTAGIYAREVPVIGRPVQVGVAQGRIISVDFPAPGAESAADAARTPDHEYLDRVEAYLDGEREDFADVPVALTLPTDRRRVLEAVGDVPYGESATVEQVRRMTAGLADSEDDRETVQAALRENPVPVLVPDHRITDAAGATPGDIATHCRRIEGIER
jgi:Methylated DNA-protein cysteine methyltransferase